MSATPAVTTMTPRQIGWRLFFTCWIVFSLHYATDIVREHYPAVALGDHLSFNLEGYCGLHPDLFELPDKGCHIGNNPGVSMLAAIPYAAARPLIEAVNRRVLASRAAAGDTVPPAYNTPGPNSRRFYAEAWRRGVDVKLELAAFVMQVFCMAPSSALGVVLIYLGLLFTIRSVRASMWLALAYAFATPVMFRTGFLNHNLMLGHIAFGGFLLLWNPWQGDRLSLRARQVLCGLAGGLAILFDYSGVIFLAGLGVYAVVKQWRATGNDWGEAFRAGVWYTLGALGPILLLWFYQYEAFGNPFLPGQSWMPPVEWIDLGYKGYQFPPVPHLLWTLLFDYRYGLFVSAPLLLLALASPFVNRGLARRVPVMELATLLALSGAMWLFFGGNNYTRLQFNTGVRYLSCLFPFLFLPAALVLARMRPATAYVWVMIGLSVAWPLAMYRKVQAPTGILDPILRTFSAGFTLPSLRRLSETTGQYGDFFIHGVSPLPLFALTGAILYWIWSPRFWRASDK